MIQALDVPASSSCLFGEQFISDNQHKFEADQEDDRQAGKSSSSQLRHMQLLNASLGRQTSTDRLIMGNKMVEKSLIIHRDENGFGLRVKGQEPIFVEHVHENGSAWRAGVRPFDRLSKVNGIPVGQLDHKEVVLMFKSCSRFVGLTLLSYLANDEFRGQQCSHVRLEGAAPQASSSKSNRDKPLRLPVSQVSSAGTGNRSSVKSCNVQPQTVADRLHQKSTHNNSRRHQCNQICSAARRSDSVMTRPSFLKQQTAPGDTPTRGGRVPFCNSCRLPIGHAFKSECQLSCPQCDMNQPSGSVTSQSSQPQHESILAAGKPDEPARASSQKLTQSVSTSSLPAATDSQAQPTRSDQKHTTVTTTSETTSSTAVVRSKATNKRLEIIREFIDTEKTHTDRLRCLDELFYRPLKAAGYMTSEQLRQVFSCHRTLYKIHRQIYRILLSANHGSSMLYSSNMPMVGSALLEIFEGELKQRLERAACAFCAAQSTNVELLNKLTRRDTKVGEFLAHVTSQQMVGRLGIKDLLASCFQRLTKYPLLLEGLLKATPTSLELADDHQPLDDGDQEEDKSLRDSRRMLAISLAEEREFIGRALHQSRQILIKVNDSVKLTTSKIKLKEIWKRTDKQSGLPVIDITKQQVIHEGPLTLRLSKRSFEVYVLLLTDYILILTREGQDKYKLKFFTPEGKSASSLAPSTSGGGGGGSLSGTSIGGISIGSTGSIQQTVFSPVFIIDEHLTTRDAATDENGFYLLCKRKDDSRIYEFASQSPAERIKWRDRIQWSVDMQMSKADRRPSFGSTITKSSSEISANKQSDCLDEATASPPPVSVTPQEQAQDTNGGKTDNDASGEPTKMEGSISYVLDDGIVMPSKMEYSRALVEQAIQVNIFESPPLKKPLTSN